MYVSMQLCDVITRLLFASGSNVPGLARGNNNTYNYYDCVLLMKVLWLLLCLISWNQSSALEMIFMDVDRTSRLFLLRANEQIILPHNYNYYAVQQSDKNYTVVCLAEFVRSVGIGLSDFECGDLLNS